MLLMETKQLVCVWCFLKFPKRESYKVLRPLGRIPLFSSEWSCKEELKLLDELDHEGFGSWHKIAKNTESKSPEDCETHYIKVGSTQQFWWNNYSGLDDLRRLTGDIVGTGNIELLRTEVGTDLRQKIDESFKQRRLLDDKELEENMSEGIIKRYLPLK